MCSIISVLYHTVQNDVHICFCIFVEGRLIQWAPSNLTCNFLLHHHKQNGANFSDGTEYQVTSEFSTHIIHSKLGRRRVNTEHQMLIVQGPPVILRLYCKWGNNYWCFIYVA